MTVVRKLHSLAVIGSNRNAILKHKEKEWKIGNVYNELLLIANQKHTARYLQHITLRFIILSYSIPFAKYEIPMQSISSYHPNSLTPTLSFSHVMHTTVAKKSKLPDILFLVPNVVVLVTSTNLNCKFGTGNGQETDSTFFFKIKHHTNQACIDDPPEHRNMLTSHAYNLSVASVSQSCSEFPIYSNESSNAWSYKDETSQQPRCWFDNMPRHMRMLQRTTIVENAWFFLRYGQGSFFITTVETFSAHGAQHAWLHWHAFVLQGRTQLRIHSPSLKHWRHAFRVFHTCNASTVQAMQNSDSPAPLIATASLMISVTAWWAMHIQHHLIQKKSIPIPWAAYSIYPTISCFFLHLLTVMRAYSTGAIKMSFCWRNRMHAFICAYVAKSCTYCLRTFPWQMNCKWLDAKKNRTVCCVRV